MFSSYGVQLFYIIKKLLFIYILDHKCLSRTRHFIIKYWRVYPFRYRLNKTNNVNNRITCLKTTSPLNLLTNYFLHGLMKIISLLYLKLKMTQARLRVKGTSFLEGGAGGVRQGV